MATTFVQHRVKDYDAWRRVYDEVADLQKAGGVIAESVYRAENAPTAVLVTHKFSSMAKAHAFFANPKLRDAMQRGGVDEKTMRIEFYEDA
jgi:hypothetical protein